MKLIIGIDPGVHTGYCVWNKDIKHISDYATLDFWSAIDKIRAMLDKCLSDGTDVTVRIENPGLNKPVYFSNKKGVKGFRASLRVAQNVGGNKRDAELLIAFCRRIEILYKGSVISRLTGSFKVEVIKPSSKKWTAEMFKAVTGIKTRVSQHVRDAAKLVIEQ